MNRFSPCFRIGFLIGILPLASFGALTPKPVLVGKFVATNVQGSVSYTSGGRILDLEKGTSLSAAGTTIETSAAAKVTLLFSNRASLVLDENTRLRIEQFDQEFFLRSDDPKMEPSKSQTTISLLAGRVVVNAPALQNGSSMTYRTSQADVAVLAERVVITTDDQQTMVAVLSGAAAVRNTQLRSTSLDTGLRLAAGQSLRVPTNAHRTASRSARPDVFPTLALASSRPPQPALDPASAALAATVRDSIAADPESAAAIAAKAATSADKASVVAFAAVRAAPAKAPQIAFAIVRALDDASASDRSLRVRAASTVAASATKAAPEQAAFITASTVQALLQNPSAPSADERIEVASTIAAVVSATASESAAEVTSAALTALALGATAPLSPQQLTLTAARVVAAVARIAPTESAGIGVAAVRWVMQSGSNFSEGELADAAGLIAAVAAQASPERATAINTGIASATNLSLMTLQASAARSTAVAAQIGQQLGGILQNATFAAQQARGLETNLNGGPKSDAVVGNALFRPDETTAAATLTDSSGESAPGTEAFSSSQIAPFDPASLGNLAGDLASTQTAQDELVFDVGTAPDGTPTVQPVPTVPATLPVEFVTSPANTTG